MSPDAREELRILQLESAYREVFGNQPEPGAPERRTLAQRLVWADLEVAGYFRRPAFVPDKDGAICMTRGAIAEGRRSLFLYIQSNVLSQPKQGA